MLRKGPTKSKLTTDFDSQRWLYDRILKNVPASETGTPGVVSESEPVGAVVVTADLDFSSWLTRVFPMLRSFTTAPMTSAAEILAPPPVQSASLC